MLFDQSEVHWYGSFGFSGPSLGAGHGLPALDGAAALGFFGNMHFSGGGFGGIGMHSSTPAPTLVGPAGGLQFDLVWDPSVAHAPKGFQQAVINAALSYTKLFSDDIVIKIRVGYGEVAGSKLDAGALGESESNYMLVSYATVAGALAGDNYPLTLARNEPTTAQIYVTNAEAKALGLMSGSVTGVDGWIGLSNSSSISYALGSTGSGKYDAVAIAEHEISEVMGRVGLEGATLQASDGTIFPNVYTPLDEFRYSAPGVPDVTPSAGYFSLNDGATQILPFNDYLNNFGDPADWATAPGTQHNAFDAFASTGRASVTMADVLAMAAIGYHV